jgi:hypothetical protein
VGVSVNVNVTVSPAGTASGIDYTVTVASNITGVTITGGAVLGDFSITNIGSGAGVEPVNWSVYGSANTSFDGDDFLLSSGTTVALAASGAYLVSFTGNWPIVPGSYYLITKVGALDDSLLTNNQITTNAAITITGPPPPDIDYIVSTITTGNSPARGGLAVSETFTIQNQGTDAGSDSISWIAYVSTDPVLDVATDTLIDSGTTSSLGAGQASAALVIDNGEWPAVAATATHYLFVDLSAADESAPGNNNTSVAYQVDPTAVDYVVASLSTVNSPATGGSNVNETFVIQNQGADDGSNPVYWTAYVSTDAFLDGADSPIDTGISSQLGTGASSGGIIIDSGKWPVVGVTTPHWLIVDLSAADESVTGNNTLNAAFSIVPRDVDYIVSTLSNTNSLAGGGSLINETLVIQNQGTDAGLATVTWIAYTSLDTVVDASDTPIDSGSVPGLAAGANTGALAVDSGNWPVVGAGVTYFLLVEVSAFDEKIGAPGPNNRSANFSLFVPTIDYRVSSISNAGTPAATASAISESFTLQNLGSDNGVSAVNWTAYFSTDTVLDGADVSIDSGTAGSLTAGATSAAIPISGTWPAAAGNYHLLVDISAGDETASWNNTGASTAFTINAPTLDYIVTDVSASYPTLITGAALQESFSLQNASGVAGVSSVTWTAHASVDITLGGDTVLGSGSTGSLGSGGVASGIALGGSWAVSAGSYYLIVEVSAADESVTANNTLTAGPFTINNPPDVDYIVNGPTGTNSPTRSGQPVAETFTVHNQGADDGSSTVDWDAYISTDAVLDTAADLLIDTGNTGALASVTTSGSISIDSGFWPVVDTTTTYYLFVDSGSSDETVTGNNSAFVSYTVDPKDIDYVVQTVSVTGTPASGGSGISETFTVQNQGADSGSVTVHWDAYISADNSLATTGDNTLVDSGTTTWLAGGATSASVAIDNGEWPVVAVSTGYHLIVDVAAVDEVVNTANNATASAQFTVIPKNIDYIVAALSNINSPAGGGSEIDESFTIQNQGSNGGSATVAWTAYTSADTVLDGLDNPIDSGAIGGLAAGQTSAAIAIDNGNWPVVGSATTYYLLVEISADDEEAGAPGANSSVASFSLVLPPIDYSVTSITSGGSPATTGSAISETFTITNSGAENGNLSVFWSAYLSVDTILDGTGEFPIGGGTLPALSTGASSAPIGISGSWPGGAGFYYLLVSIRADDETVTWNNTGASAVFTINAATLDYIVTDVSRSYPTVVSGETLREKFTLQNVSGVSGASVVNWTAYGSTDDVFDDPGDTVLGSGSTGALAAGGSTTDISLGGSWSVAVGSYYLFVKVSSADESVTNNNTHSMGVFTVGDPLAIDYIVASLTNVNTPATGGSGISETFVIQNQGSDNGSASVYWTAYVSTDAVFDAGDSPIDTGQSSPLGTGASSAGISIDSGVWPTVGVTTPYWLFVEVSASDEPAAGNNNLGAAFSIDPRNIDYTIASLTNTNSPAGGGSLINESFTIQNQGSDNGSSTVYWTAYTSTDAGLDGPDTPIDSGNLTGLLAGATSAAIPIDNGNWPVVGSGVTYYLLVDISASDEEVGAPGANTGSASFSLFVPTVDYLVSSITNAATPAATASAISESFILQNLGSNNGVVPVNWTAYYSIDAVLDGGDVSIDGGTTAALGTGASSGAIAISGTWPGSAGNYYLLINVSAGDETASWNNTTSSGSFAIEALTLDYIVADVSRTYPTVIGGEALQENFALQNASGVAGGSIVNWTAYASADNVFGGDTLLGSGTTAAQAAGSTIWGIPLSGNWSVASGSYYLFVVISSADESVTGNNTHYAGVFTVNDPPVIDYIVTSLSNVNSPATGGSGVSETFVVRNQGTDAGSDPVYWTAHISTDATLDGGDTPVDAGISSQLPAGASSAGITIDSGTWPAVAGATPYWLIVDLSAADEAVTGNNTLNAAFSVVPQDIDYVVVSLTNTNTPAPGGASISETLIIQNQGADGGSDPVNWAAYVSTDATLDGGDSLVDSGVGASLGAGASSAGITIDSGTWPTVGGVTPYWLIVDVSAADETVAGNNTGSAAFSIVPQDIDYIVSSLTNAGSPATGGSGVNETFVIENQGTYGGSDPIYWTAYMSTDGGYDAGDTPIDTGITSALGAGASSVGIAIDSGSWPLVAATTPYWVIVDVSASDESVLGNNQLGNSFSIVPRNIDYIVPSLTNVNSPAAGGSLVNESFTIQNQGGDDGFSTVTWTAYTSTDTAVDGADTPIDSGSILGLATGATSASIPIDNGNWPVVGAGVTYYLLVEVSAFDEEVGAPGSNSASSSFSLFVPTIDYLVSSITTAGTPAAVDSAVTESFILQNLGSDNGVASVNWTAYYSTDTKLDGSDASIDSGTASALASGASSAAMPITGVWPSAAGNYYLLVNVSAGDETASWNNTSSSGSFTIEAATLDYIVADVSRTYPTVITGAALQESFALQNASGIAGGSIVNWTAYASTDDVFGGDTLLGSGTTAAQAGGLTIWGIPLSGSWAVTSGSYYLFVDVSSADESVTGNNTQYAGVFTVNDPPVVDYIVTSLTNVNTPGTGGSGVSESFTIQNQGVDGGSDPVYWTAYISTDGALDGGDTPIDTGISSKLGAGASSAAIAIDSGAWPTVGATTPYWLIVDLSADDEAVTGNNSLTAAFSVVPRNIDYVIPSLTNSNSPAGGGSSINESFTIQNQGTDSGSSTVNWTAYTSTDTVIDGADTPIDSGSIAGLANGATSAAMPIDSGFWPVVGSPVTYYLLIEVSAFDEEVGAPGANGASAGFSLFVPTIDYVVTSVSNASTPATAGSAISESFVLQNTGAAGGVGTVNWTAYYSTDDELGPGDISIDNGTTSPLANGASSGAISIGGNWPGAAGNYYLLVDVSAGDETASWNNTSASGAFTINVATLDYIVADLSRIYPTVVTGEALQENFALQNASGVSGGSIVNWTAYASVDNVFGADTVLGSGTTGSQAAGSTIWSIPLSGTWSVATGTYYLFVAVDSADEVVTGNNTLSVGVFTVNDPPDIDYIVTSVTNVNTPATGGSGITESFVIKNQGSDSGSDPVNWTAYISTDATLDGADTPADAGIVSSLGAGLSSAGIAIDSGTWPDVGGATPYWLILEVTSSDEAVVGNNTLDAAFSVVPQNIDYIVLSLTNTNTPAVGGSSIAETMVIQNQGTDGGSDPVNWTAYVSTDAVLDGGDTPIDSGVGSSLGSGASSAGIAIDSGNWPTVGGITPYWLIVDVSAADETVAGNNTGSASFAIVPQDIDYIVSSLTNAGSPATGGSGVSETFVLQNQGADGGNDPVYWTAYISTDAVFDGGDTPIDTGISSQLGAGASSAGIAIDSGTWPIVGVTTSYWLFVDISAADEAVAGNNSLSAAFSIEPRNIDYIVPSLTNTNSPAGGGSLVTENFTIQNQGTDSGSSTVFWTAYTSTDAVVDGSDTPIDSGSIAGLANGATSASIPIDDGNWPVIGAGVTYYLLVEVSAFDEKVGAAGPNSASVGFSLFVPTIDYMVSSITNAATPAVTGSAISESFILQNLGSDNGVASVSWTAYYSTDAKLDGGDTPIDSDTASPLATGASSAAIPISGTWAGAAGNYYLLVDVSAGDETASWNNTSSSGSFTLEAPTLDYIVADVSRTYPTVITGEALQESFALQNASGVSGGSIVNWTAYASTDNVFGGDTVLGSGTTGSQVAGLTVWGIPLTGNWTVASGSYYLFVAVDSADESVTGNNNQYAGVFTVNDPPVIDYIVTSLTNANTPATGGSGISETLVIKNQGTDSGSDPVYWTAFISTDATLDGADTPVDTGISSQLAAGASSAGIAIDSGVWPIVGAATPHWLIVELSAGDEAVTGNNTLTAAFSIVPQNIDYIIPSLTNTNSPAGGGSGIDESFTIQNQGADSGSSTVYWTAYTSTDTVVDGADTPIDSGSIAGLANGATSAAMPIDSGNWPVIGAGVTYYLLVEVSAFDEEVGAPGANSRSASFSLFVPTIDYVVTSVSNTTTPASTGTAITESFVLQNTGAADGVGTVNWTAYYSTDTALDGGDVPIANDTTSPLANGASSGAIPIGGTWPGAAGNYYLLVDVSAGDETASWNNTTASGAFAIEAATLDYIVADVGRIYPTVITGEALQESFALQNASGVAGGSIVNWTAYASADNVFGSDTLIGSGTTGSQAAGSTIWGIPLSGNWTVAPGTYYLFVEVDSADEAVTGNNTQYSGPFTVNAAPDIDYIVTSVTNVNTPATGGSGISESLVIKNQGADNGSDPAYWTAFVSTDLSLDAGDVPVDTGITPQLTAGSSSAGIAIDSGTWPVVGGATPYWLIVEVTSTDESVVGNNTLAAAFSVVPENIDYVVFSLTSTNTPAPGGSGINETLVIRNQGTDGGSDAVHWTAYVSSDAVLDGGDSPVDSGVGLALGAASSSAGITIDSGNWPTVGGVTPYWLIVDVSAADETVAGNNTGNAAFSIVPQDIDYIVSSLTNAGSPATGGSGVSETFVLQNQGADPGNDPVYWTAYISTDAAYDAGDTPIDTGISSQLGAGASSAGIAIDSGTWPIVGVTTSYWLFMDISSADEAVTGNNSLSSAFSIVPRDIDYVIPSLTNANSPAGGGSLIDESFTVQNQGTDSGFSTVYWTAYTSTDTVVDGSDSPIDSGSIAGLANGATSASIPIDSGNWPVVGAGLTYYLLVEVSAFDEKVGAPGANSSSASFSLFVPTIDYKVSSVTNAATPAATLSAISETFTLQNLGSDDGVSAVSWTAYYSTDTELDGGDVEIDSDTTSPLTNGSSSAAIPISGTWPAGAGNYYLLVDVSAGDETASWNNTTSSGSFSIEAATLDYIVADVSRTYPTVVTGEALQESFALQNASGIAGGSIVNWSAYASADEVFGGDTVLGSGTTGSQVAGQTVWGIPLSGNWTVASGSYYLFVDVSSADESVTGNNTQYAGVFTVNDPPVVDYIVTSLTNVNTPATGGSGINENLVIKNQGTDGGTDPVYWTVFISTDAVLDGGDTPVDTGISSQLSAGSSSAGIAIDSGVWPIVGVSTSYWLIVELSAADEAVTGNNTQSAAFSVVPRNIDYIIPSLTNTNNPAAGASAVNENFTIKNQGTDDGFSTVYWTAYTSTDAVVDGADTPIDSGSIAGLANGVTSASMPIDSGNWPVIGAGVTYYLVVEVSAFDEEVGAPGANSASASFSLFVPTIDYVVTSVSNTTTPAATGSAITESFVLQNTGAADGVGTVNWTAYYSTDMALDGGDSPLDNGTTSPLANGASSGAIPIGGTWPVAAGNYYLLVDVSAGDETASWNNTSASGAFAIEAATLDYIVADVSRTYPTVITGEVLQENFALQNASGVAGGSIVNWTAYASVDNVFGGDTVLGSGTTGSQAAGSTIWGIPLSGNWTVAPGTYYLFVEVDSADEAVTGNNTQYSGEFTVTAPPDIDYVVTSLTSVNTPATGGIAVAETFIVQNQGADDGIDPVYWTAFISADAVLDGGDSTIDNGITSQLASGVSSAGIPVGGATWPIVGATTPYWLIVEVSATDEFTTGNNTRTVAYSVIPRNIDYVIPSLTNTNTPAAGGSAIDESFTIQNQGADSGSSTVVWTAYASLNTVIDGSDTPVDSGSIAALANGATSASIPIDSGTWPVIGAGVTYYLLVEVSAFDEQAGAPGANTAWAGFSLYVPTIDYVVTSVSNTTTPAATASVISESFALQNTGSDDGSETVSWTAYYSADTDLDGGDVAIDNGTTSPLANGATSGAIPIGGTWPGAAGNYYLLVDVSAGDETASWNNTNSSGEFTIEAATLDYIVADVSRTYPTVMVGDTLRENFALQNASTVAGGAIVNWTAYASTDDVFGGDTVLGSGTTSSLVAGLTVWGIPLSGTWAVAPGDYYLFVDISSADEAITGNNNEYAGTFTVQIPLDVDYGVNQIIHSSGTTADGAFSGTFKIQNSGGDAGSDSVHWWAYVSTDNAIGSDIMVDSGTTPGLGGSVISGSIPFSGTWPSSAGDYWLVIALSATDDINNGNDDGIIGAPITVTGVPSLDVDYTTVLVSNGTPVAATSSGISETFTFYNGGADNGGASVTWIARRSLDTVLDGSDVVIDAGSTTALNASATSSAIALGGAWPASGGVYYIIVSVSSSDEINTTNNYGSSAAFSISTVTTIDYVISAVSAQYPTVVTGSPISETFDLQNIGDTAGATDVTWTLYASSDTVLDAGDNPARATSITPSLAASGSRSGVNMGGTWPAAAGTYYLIVEIAADEAGPETGNNTNYSGPFIVNDPPDYKITSPNFPLAQLGGNIGETLSTATGTGNTFVITEEDNYPGNQAIAWNAYLSTDPLLDGADVRVAWGAVPALGALGSSSAVNINQAIAENVLSATPGYFHIIIKISAGDDADPSNDSFVSPPFGVWKTTGNLEVDTNENDTYLNMAEDYAIVLNPTDTVQIEGATDIFDSPLYNDLFLINTGPSTTSLDIIVSWSTGEDDIDLYVFDSGGSLVASSQTVATDAEPATPLNVAVSGNSVYYINTEFFLHGDGGPKTAPGTQYFLDVTAN